MLMACKRWKQEAGKKVIKRSLAGYFTEIVAPHLQDDVTFHFVKLIRIFCFCKPS